MIAFSTFPMLLIYAAPLRFCSGLCFISFYRVVSRSQVRENDLFSMVLLQATWLTRTDFRLPKKLKETDENQGFPKYIVQLESWNKNWRQGVMHIEEAIRKISNTFRNFPNYLSLPEFPLETFNITVKAREKWDLVPTVATLSSPWKRGVTPSWGHQIPWPCDVDREGLHSLSLENPGENTN
jgi:hypothetical protein